MDRIRNDATVHCCAECGNEGGISLKACKSCMVAKYCNVNCQKNHWPKHKKECKIRAAELRDEALFKDPLAKEDCPICFIPMPYKLISCITLPPATIMSVPVYCLRFCLAPHVGCRRVVFLPKRRHSVRHVSVMSQTQENVVSARVSKRHDI